MQRTPISSDKPQLVEIPTSSGILKILCRVERSPRLRNLKLYLNDAHEAVLKIPTRCSLNYAYGFLKEKGDWLSKAIKNSPPKLTLIEHLRQEAQLSAFGKDYRLIIDDSNQRSSITFFVDYSDICLRYNPETSESELVQMLVKFAQKVIPHRVCELANQLNLPISRVSVRNQRTRWGSCATSRVISLNWRLVLLRANLHDHIIFHELAHLREMNHSKRFKTLLQQYDPSTKLHEKLIHEVQRTIMRIGR